MANEAAIQNSNADQHTSSCNDETEANNDDNDIKKEGSGIWDFFDHHVAKCTAVCTAYRSCYRNEPISQNQKLRKKGWSHKVVINQEAVYPNLQRNAKNTFVSLILQYLLNKYL